MIIKSRPLLQKSHASLTSLLSALLCQPQIAPAAANHVDGSPVAPHINSNVWAGASQNAAAQLPHGTSLTSADLDRIRSFITELCSRALVPHIERQIQYLNDQVCSLSFPYTWIVMLQDLWHRIILFGNNPPNLFISAQLISELSDIFSFLLFFLLLSDFE